MWNEVSSIRLIKESGDLQSEKERRTMRWIIAIFAKINFLSYRVISELSVKMNNGNHVKHNIMKYEQFFLDNISSKDSVLDVGCGSGYIISKIAKKAKKAVGIDIIDDRITKARKKYSKKNLEFITGDATSYQFKDQFDVVILSNVLEHIAKRVLFLKKLKRIAPVILIRVPLITRSWLPVYLKSLNIEYRLDRTHEIEYTEKEIISEIEKAGLRPVSVEVRWGEIYIRCE